MRNTEIEIESMVGKGGKEMWSKLDEIGPKLKRKNIPEEVIIDSMIETNIDVVKEKWVSDFAGLYAGIPIEDQNFDKIFLQEVLDNKYNYTSKSTSRRAEWLPTGQKLSGSRLCFKFNYRHEII